MNSDSGGIELSQRLSDWVLRHRALTILLILVITALAAWHVAQMPIQRSLLEAFVDDPTEFDTYRRRVLEFGGDSDDLIYLATQEGDALFTPAIFNAIRNAARELRKHPEVKGVDCLPDALWTDPATRLSPRQIIARRLLQGKIRKGTFDPEDDDLPVTRAWPVHPKRQARVNLAEVKEAMLEDQEMTGLLLSNDGSTQIMVVQLKSSSQMPLPKQIALIDEIHSILDEAGLGQNGVHIAGLVISQGSMFDEISRAFLVYFPIGLVLIFTIVYLLFQRLSVVLMTATVGSIAIFWGVAATAVVFGKPSVLVAAAPLVIFVISTSDVIHLTTAYKLELAAGHNRDDALRTTMREVGGACVLTSITTFVGFLSLMLVPAPSMRHLGLAVAVGVASALLIALTIVPIWFSFMRPLPTGDQGLLVGASNQLIARFVSWCNKISLQYATLVVAGCVLLLIAALAGMTQMHIDADFPKRFPKGHPTRTSIEFFNEQLSGIATVEVFVQSDDESLLQPEILRVLDRVEKKISAMPEVSEVYSIVALYRTADRMLLFRSASDAEESGIALGEMLPETKVAAETSMKLFRKVDQKRLQSLINDANLHTRLSVRMIPTGYMEVSKIAERMDAMVREELAKEQSTRQLRVDTSGSYPIVGRVVQTIARNQLLGLLTCFVAVTIIMALGIRSARNAIFAQFPNILPAALLLGVLGISLSTIDTDMLGIPTVALGIAVDDTIHFLHRYKLQKAKTGDRLTALNETFPYTGRAIMQTTVILSVGFLPFALSSFLTVWMLGTYLVFTLVCAVLGDLLLLPAMIKLGWIE